MLYVRAFLGWLSDLLVEPFLYLFTKKTKTIRAICRDDFSPKMTDMVRDAILNRNEFLACRQLLLKHKPFNVETMSQLFMKEARVDPSSSYYNEEFRSKVSSCFHQLVGTNIAQKVVDDLIAEKYDRENEDHESLLLELWSNLRPDEILRARESEQWSSIGFQGRDPATDFRGLGVLSLSNLVYYSRQYPAAAIDCLRHSDIVHGGYPMAITGIQLSALLNKWLQKRVVDREFYSVDVEDTMMSREERALHFYQELFCRTFTRFDAFYETKHPDNLLQFPIIMQEFEERTLQEIKENVF